MNPHKQVLTGVNMKYEKIMAKIDENIKNVIITLNKFDGLETIECCQGDENISAWICFKYKHWEHSYQNLVDFVFGFLAPYLMKRIGDSVTISVYFAPSGNIFGELMIRPGAIRFTEMVLEDAYQLFESEKRK